MTQTICRLYATQMQAMRAAAELRSRSYLDVHVFAGPAATAVEGEAPAQGNVEPDLLKSMMEAYIFKPHAEVYAARVSKGASLVAVHAPFGTAQQAINVLESHGAIEDGIPPPPPSKSYAYDERVPLSSALQLPVLTKTQLPFEAIAGVGSLTRRPRLYTAWLLPVLTRVAAPFSSMFGLPTRTRSATPFSSLFGLPVLKKR
jgi:hypothetical protein